MTSQAQQLAQQAHLLNDMMRRYDGVPPSNAGVASAGLTPNNAGLTPGSFSATSYGESSSSMPPPGSGEAKPAVAAGAAEDLPPHDLLQSLSVLLFPLSGR